jgi:hypothetical protein
MSARETAMNRTSKGTLSAHRTLLTGSWTAAVDAMQASILRIARLRRPASDCRVVFFETAGDARLHVNVTHRRETKAAQGWTGAARLPEGFVHTRLFDDTPAREIIGRVREMVFAEPSDA